MPAKDIFHDAVKNALIKENWTITDDPLYLEFGGVDMYVDLGAEKLVGAEKEGKQIAVEIKSFLRQSLISEFHNALGQFINYRTVLRRNQPDRTLYLAVSEDAYETFFTLMFTQIVVEENEIKLIIYEPQKEVIVQWIN